MSKVVTSYANFSKAKLDHDMGGRYDLPIYNTGADVFQNFISNFKGNAIFSVGFLEQVAFQDCAFIEFKFGINQNYLCVFYAGFVQFLAFDTNNNFGWVLNGGGTTLTVVSPYALADAKTISHKGSFTQNADAMVIAHRSYAPMKLVRTSANSFTLATYTRTADPFYGPVADTSTTSNTISTGAKTFTVTAAQGYVVGASIILISTASPSNFISGTVTSYSTTSLVVNITSAVGSGTFTAWTITQVANWPGTALFYKGRLYFASSLNKPTTVWFSNSGLYDDFTIQGPLTDASGFSFGIADIVQQIEWLFPGDNSLIAGSTAGIVAINGGQVNTSITPATVQANITSAEPTNGVYPIKKEGLMFYVGQNNRNMYYLQYDILTQLFLAKDANISSYDVTLGGLTKIRYKKDRNDLIVTTRGDGQLCSLNFKQVENIIGWHERLTSGIVGDIAVIGDTFGNPQLFQLVFRNGTYYIEQQAAYVEFTKRDNFNSTLTGQYATDQTIQSDDDEAYARAVAEQLRNCVFLDNAVTFSDLHAVSLTFTPVTFNSDGTPATGNIVAASASFASGDLNKHIVYKTSTGYESGRFLITGFTDTTHVAVTVLQQPKGKLSVALYTWASWYKSFITISGLSQYNGQSVGICTDGGFLESAVISGGAFTFPEQTCSVVIGYQYTGTIKTFCLGFVIQGQNTQTTVKNIVRVGVRCLTSAGGQVGSSWYALEDVQELSQNDFNYLPPMPIDGTKYVDYVDDAQEDKYLYAVQSQPLPFEILNLSLEANYAMSS